MPQLPFTFRDLTRRTADPGSPPKAKAELEADARPKVEAQPHLPSPPEAATEAPSPEKDEAVLSPPRVFSVSELQRTLRVRLENQFGEVSVRGEVSNLRVQSSGHAYFTLKDRRAQLNAVLFATERARLPFRLDDGMSVVAAGRITIYDRSGALQLRVLRCTPEGEGALWAQFQERARKLRAEGLTDPATKRPLPRHPRRIGVVTSRTGAALRDVVRTLIRRDPAVRIRLCHAQVQGRRSTGDLVSAIRCIDRFGDIDVLIVARGGGSLEDLWAFNEEPVARAIIACSVPVVVGVGHETDLTIADMVADKSASTPTAAAAAAVPDYAQVQSRIAALEQRMRRAVRERLTGAQHRLHSRRADLELNRPPLFRWAQELDSALHRAHCSVSARLRRDQSRLSALTRRLQAASPSARLVRARSALEGAPERLTRALQLRLSSLAGARSRLEDRLHPAVTRRLASARARWTAAGGRLDALSPLAVLARGYALVRTEDGRVVRRPSQVEVGHPVEISIAQGRIRATVTEAGPAVDSPMNVDEAD